MEKLTSLAEGADRTERILLAEEARDAARAASETTTNFLAAMSHQIRSPIAAALGFAEILLQRDDLEADVRRQIGLIHQAGQVLVAVVNNILDFSTLEAGKIVIDNKPFAVSLLVKGIADIIRTSAEQKGLRLITVVGTQNQDWFLGDSARIGQVLLNLLHNAVKCTHYGSIVVRVEVEDEATNPPVLRFSVKDSGIGIATDKQDRLFKQFSQVEGADHQIMGGTGLGLAICKQLVERMEGEIGVDSEDGQGAEFWFRLPLAHGQPIVEGRLREATETLSARILLVDDAEADQEIAATQLRRAGHAVHIVGNGREAVEAAQAGDYDLVLMDVQMPVLDGLAATEQIRRFPGPTSAVPIVAMTATVLPTQIAACTAAGMNAHLAKPFTAQQLTEMVARWGPRHAVVTDMFDQDAFNDLKLVTKRERLSDYLDSLQQMMEELPGRQADRIAIARQAHKLASIAGIIGFARLSKRAAELEEACLSTDEMAPAIASFEAAKAEASERLHLLRET